MSEIQRTNWNLKSDKMHQYAFWDNFLSKEECKKIIKQGKKLRLKKSVTINSPKKKGVRKSDISWIYPDKDTLWLFRRATDVILDLNNQFFNFDISGLNEGFQFTNYKYPDGHYGKHIDRAFDIEIRKLSISIQLTDPKDYKGGNLILNTGNICITDSGIGNIIIFPSFLLHKVSKMESGNRYSIVSWVSGSPWK